MITGSPAFAGDDTQGLLRRDPHLRRRRLDVGRDVALELGEVLLEHADEVARGFVELGLVLPGLERIEQMWLDAMHRGRYREPEIGIGAEVGILERAVERGGQQRARRLDRHAAIVEQCKVSPGYPYVLARAHEIAVVTNAERAEFDKMIATQLTRQGLDAKLSEKQFQKSLLAAKPH